MKVLKYPAVPATKPESDIERRVEQLAVMAKALTTEMEILQAELYRRHPTQIDFDRDSIDFYGEVERYEIELISNALNKCNGNQARAAKLLRMKSSTLNAKLKHYGINPVRSVRLQRANIQSH